MGLFPQQIPGPGLPYLYNVRILNTVVTDILFVWATHALRTPELYICARSDVKGYGCGLRAVGKRRKHRGTEVQR